MWTKSFSSSCLSEMLFTLVLQFVSQINISERSFWKWLRYKYQLNKNWKSATENPESNVFHALTWFTELTPNRRRRSGCFRADFCRTGKRLFKQIRLESPLQLFEFGNRPEKCTRLSSEEINLLVAWKKWCYNMIVQKFLKISKKTHFFGFEWKNNSTAAHRVLVVFCVNATGNVLHFTRFYTTRVKSF